MSKPGPQAILATYLSRTCNRRSALMGFASGIAMSALHAGYDLSIGELSAIVEDAYHTNPSTSKRTRKEFIAALGGAAYEAPYLSRNFWWLSGGLYVHHLYAKWHREHPNGNLNQFAMIITAGFLRAGMNV